MFLILETESAATDAGLTGPCLQYLLTSKLLTKMAKGLLPDNPVGCRTAWLDLMLQLMERMQRPLLLHGEVLEALRLTFKTCSHPKSVLSDDDRRCHIQLLCVVMKQVSRDPTFLTLLFDTRGKGTFQVTWLSRTSNLAPHPRGLMLES